MFSSRFAIEIITLLALVTSILGQVIVTVTSTVTIITITVTASPPPQLTSTSTSYVLVTVTGGNPNTSSPTSTSTSTTTRTSTVTVTATTTPPASTSPAADCPLGIGAYCAHHRPGCRVCASGLVCQQVYGRVSQCVSYEATVVTYTSTVYR